jgi:hypothetical protein
MDAVSILRGQVTSGHALFTATVKGIGPSEWTARPDPGGNVLGFTAWHVPAVQDWALHTWMRGLPELRGSAALRTLPGIDPPFAPFGMSLDAADAIAAAVAPNDVLAYADAVLEAASRLLDTLTEAALDAVPNTREHGTRLPRHQTPGYLAEVDDMYDLPVWRLLAGPCFGHVREHVGEMRLALQILRARP